MAKRAGGTEWVGGRFPAPMLVSDGGDVDYRPELSLWLEVDGPIVGMELTPPGDRDAPTVALLDRCMKKPLDGPPRRPARVRVADAGLAERLREAYGKRLEIVVGATPELAPVLDGLRDHFAGEETFPPGYLELEGVSAAQAGALHRAAAKLYRAAPWNLLSGDPDPLTVTVEELGVRERVVSVIGELGETYGFVVFENLADLDRFADESEFAMATGGVPELPPQVSLSFEDAEAAGPACRAEVAAHGWELAGLEAYPRVMALRGTVPRDPTSRDLEILEAVSNAIAAFVAPELGLAEALEAGDGLAGTFQVAAGARTVRVQLSARRRSAAARAAGTSDFDPDDADEAVDEAEAFETELLERFAASPEGAALAEPPTWTRLVLESGRSSLGLTPAELDAGALREILFEHFPRKVSCRPDVAPSIAAELRAFWTWGKREQALAHADQCLSVLRPGVERTLERALADTTKYGIAKSFFMAGDAAGFDMESERGRTAWMDVYNARLAAPAPSKPGPSAEEKERRKKARKAQKAARRRNR